MGCRAPLQGTPPLASPFEAPEVLGKPLSYSASSGGPLGTCSPSNNLQDPPWPGGGSPVTTWAFQRCCKRQGAGRSLEQGWGFLLCFPPTSLEAGHGPLGSDSRGPRDLDRGASLHILGTHRACAPELFPRMLPLPTGVFYNLHSFSRSPPSPPCHLPTIPPKVPLGFCEGGTNYVDWVRAWKG